MKIDKVYFINLPRGVDRYWAQTGALGVMGVPSDRVECFEGIDAAAEKYNTFAKIAGAMVEDGFPEWGVHRETKEYLKGPRSLAVQWSHLRCLRQIVERGENAIVLEDDCFIIKPFEQMERALSYLPDNLKGVFLDWSFIIETDGRIWHDTRYRQNIIRSDVTDLYTGYIPAGHRATFYTPLGAKDKLDAWKDEPWQNGESVLWDKNQSKQTDGYFFALPYWALLWTVELKTEGYKP